MYHGNRHLTTVVTLKSSGASVTEGSKFVDFRLQTLHDGHGFVVQCPHPSDINVSRHRPKMRRYWQFYLLCLSTDSFLKKLLEVMINAI